MSALQIVTFVAAGVLVLAVAATLIAVAVVLVRIRRSAGAILEDLQLVSRRTEPVNDTLTEIADRLVAVKEVLAPLEEPSPARHRR